MPCEGYEEGTPGLRVVDYGENRSAASQDVSDRFLDALIGETANKTGTPAFMVQTLADLESQPGLTMPSRTRVETNPESSVVPSPIQKPFELLGSQVKGHDAMVGTKKRTGR
jgi:hypothetical protein